MIRNEDESATIQELMKLLEPIDVGETFLLNLRVISFTLGKCFGCESDWTFASILILVEQDDT
jgi:hypothetical protein